MKKSFTYIFIIILLIMYEFGLYQKNDLIVNNIIFDKPIFSKMIFTKLDNNKTSNIKNILGLQSVFHIKNSSIMFIFDSIFKNKTSLLFSHTNNAYNNFILLNKNYLKNDKKCAYVNIKKIYDIYAMEGVIKNKNINFVISSDKKNNIMSLKNSICE